MKGRFFLDTNVLVYADDLDAGEKGAVARRVLQEAITTGRGVLSTQVLQEFFVVTTRKLGVDAAVARRKVELLATLDVVSNGRVDLGVGVGWQPEEFAACGVPFEERWSRLDDGLRACRALWGEAPASFTSKSVSFERIWSLPRPVQPNGIPIWFGVAPSVFSTPT